MYGIYLVSSLITLFLVWVSEVNLTQKFFEVMENVAASFSRVKMLIILEFCNMSGIYGSQLPDNMNFNLVFEVNLRSRVMDQGEHGSFDFEN